jgi:Flp pilus assembly protein TadD
VNSEREDIGPGRANLQRALALDPEGAGYAGELATLETFANRLDEADAEYERALQRHSADYVALTGRALLALKRGDADGALDLLLRATLMEPRYARAHMYMAVAYYRLGRIDRALEELARASELDPKDPFPHMLRSIVYNDVIEPGQAVEAGRTARDLMPFLKSLNQLANNQKGTANLGSAFAFFGMEEWAMHLAQESYYPYWAGSHLFLGDRYAGSFNKNSEYYQGTLADPTVFGASTRYQTLVPKPGTYLNTGFRSGADGESVGSQPYFTVNGYSNRMKPLAYFLDLESTHLEPDVPSIEATQKAFTGAVGMAPAHDIGLFGFGNYTGSDARVTNAELVDVPVTLIEKRLDVGGQYRFRPTSVAWVKVGRGRELASVRGPSNSRAFDELLFGADIDIDFREVTDSRDVQLRHTFSLGDSHEVSWGAESGDRDKLTTFIVSVRVLPEARIPTTAPVKDESRVAYVSDRMSVGPLVLQGDLFIQQYSRRASQIVDASLFDLGDIVTADRVAETSVSPRVGAVFHFTPGRLVRYTHQRWVRPASFNTLSPVDTVGVPLDDRLVALGGALERHRVQAEWEWTSRTFTFAFFDHKDVANLTVSDEVQAAPDLDSLRRLRNVVQINTAAEDLLEDTPSFQAATVRSGGVALNQLISDRWSVYSRLFLNDSENTSAAFTGNRVPWLPRRLFSLGGTWVGPRRLYVNGQVIHRTRRFEDEANLAPVAGDWRGQVSAYWEVPSKKWSIEAVVSDLFSDIVSTSYGIDVKFRY